MIDAPFTIDAPLTGLPKDDWLQAVSEVAEEDGFFENLGDKHYAIFVERKPTLLVTFETVNGMRALSEMSHPLGWEMVRTYGWSHLCIASEGDTWFRDPAVYDCFDTLIDDGFFDKFERVIFYGAGPGGYAAAAYSVASPGAQVVMIQPQATLDPRVTEWDDRFVEMRRTDFTSRYGYAPDMLDAAASAFVLYDPKVTLDAMHAALFTRPNVTKLRMPHMGLALQSELLQIDQLETLLKLAADGQLNAFSFATLYRARRDHRNYLKSLLVTLEAQDRKKLILHLCHYVNARMQAPRFARKQKTIEAELKQQAEAQKPTDAADAVVEPKLDAVEAPIEPVAMPDDAPDTVDDNTKPDTKSSGAM
ncbi:phosphoadenosine phosphosulfate reductase [uncultured Sulfitobacter sp.]|uniref:phosphoadenosine phosphosulfate reductase n=1 Tax=uncultured Sulfitobacter sp. TaxID=191468 RepID=UPI0030DA8F64|tara:strand:+ start:58438 stop:59526 length:1089 start_codon:yes stop_codon:yes gene_type:complete